VVTTLGSDTIARRRLAWSALSELFCDSEIRGHLPRAALDLVESGYDDGELEAIFLDELTPVLHWNLKQVLGACDIDPIWLERQVMKKRAPEDAPRKLGAFGKWLQRFRAGGSFGDFRVLLALVDRARAIPPEERDAWARGLATLARLYFERPSLDAFLDRHTDRLLAAGLRTEQIMQLPARDLYPLFQRLRVRGVDPAEHVARARVEECCARASGEFPAQPR
jgi:hypothetical protein